MFGRRTTSSQQPNEFAEPQTAGAQGDVVAEFQSLWEPAVGPARKSVEQLLLERGQITEEQLDQARKVAAQTPGKTLSQILATMNAATESQLLSALAETLGMPFETPEKTQIDTE